MNRIVFVAVVPAVLAWSSIAQAPEPPSPERQLLKLVNMEREHARLAALRWDAKVAEAAQTHTGWLASHNVLSHQFEGEPELTHRVNAAGVRFSAVGENVAQADDPEEAHLALMQSPGHRANIMSSEYNVVGIGVISVKNRLYVTEDFAHAVPAYSEQEFREGVVSAFNRLRSAHRLAPINVHPDPALDRQACSGQGNAGAVLQGFSGPSRATVFTAVDPNELPPMMDSVASDISLHRMNIGVCFRPDAATKFAKFWVVAAFYHTR